MNAFSFIRPTLGQEYPPPDEPAHLDAIVSEVRTQFQKTCPIAADSTARRDQHPKAHGCTRATFTVEADVPENLRHGIFRKPHLFEAWVRFSSSSPQMDSDTKRDAHGMAIKLMDVPGPKMLENERDAMTQDFILANSNVFFVRSAADYVLFAQAFSNGRIMGFVFNGWNPFRWRLHELFNMLTATRKLVTNPLRIRYWSQTPSRLGPQQAVKYSARPVAPTAGGTKDPAPSTPDALRHAMAATLRQGDEVVFEFLVQIQTDPVTMPVEDATIVWDERVSPFVRVATLRIPPQSFDTPERDAFSENLSFTPWHTLPDHQPLGTTNRTRRLVYEEISRLRHLHNHASRVEPTPGEGPL